MRAERNWRMDFKWIMILGIVDFLLLFQVLPVIYMVIRAFWPEGEFSLTTVERLFSYPLNWEALKNTLIASFATMILGTLIAFPLAWLVGRTNLYGKKFFRALFVLTYMVPPYVGAMAWLRLMNPNVGTINQWLRVIFHLSDTPGPLNVYTVPGMIWVLTTFYYPYAFITISRAMEKMDPSLEEASRISGATPVKTIFTVTLPMMTPSLISGALLVFISAASCYGIPSIIGTPGNVNTVTTRIVEYVALGQQGLNDATGLAIFLMVVALGILFLSDVVLAKKQYITVSGKSVQPAIVDLRGWRTPLTILVSLFAGIMVLLPFATILTTSFKIDIGKSMLAEGNFTTANWTSIFSRGETISCLKNSLIFAAVAATVGLIIACVMSYLLQRTRIRGRTIPNFLITLGSGTPSVVIALGLIMTMRGNFGVNIYNTAYILIIAYLIKYLMMGMRTVVSAMSQIHVSLEECSQVSGASWLRTMFRITGPLIFPSIAAGWFLIFIPSFYELSMTTLLYSSTTKTIGYQLYEYWTFTSQPMSCAMAFGILLIVIGLNFVLNRLTKGEFSI
ncbi:MAG: iron ABC transporter permease [Clostridia bacterium]|nr:iron ABC transporter permease [Clostridia bacterium]